MKLHFGIYILFEPERSNPAQAIMLELIPELGIKKAPYLFQTHFQVMNSSVSRPSVSMKSMIIKCKPTISLSSTGHWKSPR